MVLALRYDAACSILPPDADLIELTADAFPSLAQLSPADMHVSQQRLTYGRRYRAASVASAADVAPEQALGAELARLDKKHPGLADVRSCLEARAAALAGGGGGGGLVDPRGRARANGRALHGHR